MNTAVTKIASESADMNARLEQIVPPGLAGGYWMVFDAAARMVDAHRDLVIARALAKSHKGYCRNSDTGRIMPRAL